MKKQTKNKVIKTITALSIINLFAGASGLDGENIVIPVIMIAVSLIWLFLFAAANGK